MCRLSTEAGMQEVVQGMNDSPGQGEGPGVAR